MAAAGRADAAAASPRAKAASTCVKVLLDAGADINVVDPDGISALVLALINGHYDVAGAADRRGRRRQHARQGRPDRALRRRRRPHDAGVEPAGAEGDRRRADQPGRDQRSCSTSGAKVDAALRAQVPYRTKLDRGGDGVLGAGTTPLLRAAKAGDVAGHQAAARRRARMPRAATRNGVNAIMMAANVAAREEDMTGRNKTQKDAIESITAPARGGDRHQRRRHAGPNGARTAPRCGA